MVTTDHYRRRCHQNMFLDLEVIFIKDFFVCCDCEFMLKCTRVYFEIRSVNGMRITFDCMVLAYKQQKQKCALRNSMDFASLCNFYFFFFFYCWMMVRLASISHSLSHSVFFFFVCVCFCWSPLISLINDDDGIFAKTERHGTGELINLMILRHVRVTNYFFRFFFF